MSTSRNLRIACPILQSYVAVMDERNVGADEEVDPLAYSDDHEDEGGEKTGQDLEEVAEEDSDAMPPDGDDEKVNLDKGEVA